MIDVTSSPIVYVSSIVKLYGNFTSTGLSFTFSTMASCFTDASPNVFDIVVVIYKTIQKKYTILLTLFILDTDKYVLFETVKTQIKCCIMQHFIWVCTVC